MVLLRASQQVAYKNLLKVALSRFSWCQNFVFRFFILSATKNLRRSKYSNFLLIKKLSVLVCSNFWLQRGWKIGVQNFGTNWIEINLPLLISYTYFTKVTTSIFKIFKKLIDKPWISDKKGTHFWTKKILSKY